MLSELSAVVFSGVYSFRWTSPCFTFPSNFSCCVKVTYLGIRSAHERVWLVERKPIWLPRAYLTRGDLEPARGNLHVCKFLRELTNIQIRTVTAERGLCSECICPTNVLQLNEGRKEGRRERRKEGRQARTKRRERKKEGRRTREKAREKEQLTREREGESARLNTPWNQQQCPLLN